MVILNSSFLILHLFAYRAALALIQFSTETLLHQQMQAVFQCIQTDGIDYFVHEGEHQQQDFKFEISDARKIAKTLSAFSNTDGGR